MDRSGDPGYVALACAPLDLPLLLVDTLQLRMFPNWPAISNAVMSSRTIPSPPKNPKKKPPKWYGPNVGNSRLNQSFILGCLKKWRGWWISFESLEIPSGNLVQFAIENGHRNNGFTPKKMVNFHSYVNVYQRVIFPCRRSIHRNGNSNRAPRWTDRWIRCSPSRWRCRAKLCCQCWDQDLWRRGYCCYSLRHSRVQSARRFRRVFTWNLHFIIIVSCS